MHTPFCNDKDAFGQRLPWQELVQRLQQQLTAISIEQPQIRFHVPDLECTLPCHAEWDAASGLVINGKPHCWALSWEGNCAARMH